MKDESNSLLAQFDDSKRILASLMARENITVQVVDGLDTAYFDTVHRIMRVPAWKGLSKDQVDVLVGHETGHALFTDNSVFESLAKDNKRGLFSYLNVVEDARIERKMRNSYPGLQRVFYKGYSEFFQNGPIFKGQGNAVFGRDGQQLIPVAGMKLIDRINLHFKIGAFVKVPFSASELQWVRRIERCADTDEALEIARALHKLSKDPEPAGQPQPGQDGQSGQPDKSDNSDKSQSKSKSDKTPQNDEGDESDSGDDSDSQNGDEQDGDTKDSDQDGDGNESEKSDKSGDESDEQDGDQDGDGSEGDESDEDGEDSGSDGDSDGDESDENADGDSDGDDSDSDADGDSGDSDSDGDDSDSDSPSDSSKTDGQSGDGENPITPENSQDDEGDDDDVAESQTAADEALKGATAPSGKQEIKNVLIAPLSEKVVNERTVTAAQWTDATIKALDASGSNWKPVVDKLEQNWKDKFAATVKNMAREFDARKNAKAAQQARTAKSGKLNVEKLASYKFTNDLFIRTMTMPRGQSHGIVMVIDGSGSMNDTFASVLDQTLLFAHFAMQVNVPFEAYMFTNGHAGQNSYTDKKFRTESAGLQTLGLPADGQLVGLVNTNSDKGSFRRQVRAVLAMQAAFRFDWSTMNADPAWYQATQTIPYVHLYYTPLYVGVMLAERHMARMKRQLRLDKMMLVVISDGEDSSGLVYDSTEVNYDGKLVTRQANIREKACIVRDTVSKKVFAVGTVEGRYATVSATSVLSMLFDVVRARHDARVIFMYLVKQTATRRGAKRIVTRNNSNVLGALRFTVRQGMQSPEASIVTAAFDADGQYVIPADRNVGDLTLLVATSSLEMDETTFDSVNTNGMSTKKIAAAFTETMTANKANRVFVNTLIPFLI